MGDAPWITAGRHRPRIAVLAAVNRPRVRSELLSIERILQRSADIVAIDRKINRSTLRSRRSIWS